MQDNERGRNVQMNYVEIISLTKLPYLYECFPVVGIQLERSGVLAGEVGDVLPARPGHHLTGGDHTDGGGHH